MTRLRYLDGWRGCAIIGVLLGHFANIHFISLGRFGVELFFVLSGRLMAEILFVKKQTLREFSRHRFARIYPAMVVFVIVAGMIDARVDNAQITSCLTFTYNYFRFRVGGDGGIVDHIWSLCVEVHMYFFLAVVAALQRRYNLPPLPICVTFAAIMIVNGWLLTLQGLDYYHVYWRTDVRGASLLCGVIAFLLLSRVQISERAAFCSTLLLGIAGIVLSSKQFPDAIKYSAGTLSLACALAIIPKAPELPRKLLDNTALAQIGIWSYSIYLWQQPFYKLDIHGIAKVLPLAGACACGVASFYLIERPTRRYLNRFFGGRSIPPIGESPAA